MGYMKKVKILILTSILLTSCEDFTQKNLDVAVAPVKELDNIDLLLSETSRINSGSFTIEKFLANTGSFVTQPLVERMANELDSFNQSVNQYCLGVEVLTELSLEQLKKLREPVQENWKKAMSSYHQLSMMSYGPAALASSTVMNSLYTFDGEEKCRVDFELYKLSTGGITRLPRTDVINNYNVRGLDALEPLFFGDPNKSRCSRPNSRIVEWFKTPLLSREKTACTYAKHLLKDIQKKGRELAKLWSPNEGHYTATMLRGGAGSPIELTNSIGQGLFLLDTNTKDVKLAYPAGFEVRIDGTVTKCPESVCPKKREHLYADFSLEAIESSLVGFRLLFLGINPQTGVNGFGFDDLLRSRDHGDVAEKMSSALENVLKSVRSFKESTSLALALENLDPVKCEQTTADNRLEEACALVWDIREVTNLLKNEYLSALQELSAPGQAQGDAD